ncbi:E3 ubiquitin-protein ligase TRIM9-like [Saccostrea echinata]|uniref:E3 ubiquitin-protein ligase TRIM9-like n=1 Tax=Saccostrea echinata TaxID=191078 RepID=UPI002A7F00B9|nr:E3 ubiquitin-protein ligase TRIM9-like [Saccostrea echinata]
MEQKLEVLPCQYCEREPALFFCVPCGDEFCSGCKLFHLKSNVPSGHNVIPISERQDPCNKVKMCEIHETKPYEVSCAECKVPLCLFCVQESHGEHAIGKLKDMYEEQKGLMLKELTDVKNELRPQICHSMEDLKSTKAELKESHKNMRTKMKEQAKHAIDHVTSILNEKLRESYRDENKEEAKISREETKLEVFLQQLQDIIQKYENLTETSHPAELILYRKNNPDVVQKLELPDRLLLTPPSFTAGQIMDNNQFGNVNKTKITYQKTTSKTKSWFSYPKKWPYFRNYPII